MKLTLSGAFSETPFSEPLLSGAIRPEGIEWVCSKLHPSEMYWRQLRYGDFDVSEMSLASLIIAVSKGMTDWTALPVFTTGRFFHTGILVRADAGIDGPEDLAGKRLGVPEYQQTSAVWCRGALEHEFGVSPRDVHWFMERGGAVSHGGSTGFAPPDGVRLEHIPGDSSIAGMLRAGDLDGSLVYLADRNLVDRSRADWRTLPGVRPLFDDPQAEGLRYHEKTGFVPVNHCVVVRTSVLERAPWVALNVYAAFVRAKQHAIERTVRTLQHWERIAPSIAAGMPVLQSTDPLPYGVTAQRRMLETLAGYLVEQGLAERAVAVEEFVARTCLDI